MKDIFETEITYLKGVGPKRADMLKKELNINTFDDLLNYYPFRYVDKSKIYKVSDVRTDSTYFQMRGKISNLTTIGDKRTRYITATFTDESGSIDLVWFRGLSWVKNRFVPGKTYTIFGKPSIFKNHFNFVHPEVEDFLPGEDELSGERLEGIYSSTEKLKNIGFGSRGISQAIKTLLKQCAEQIRENLPDYLVHEHKLLDRKSALLNIHFPANHAIIDQAINRLKFEELFFIQLQILISKKNLKEKIVGLQFDKVGENLNKFYHNHLPFQLTNAQKKGNKRNTG